MVPQTGIVTQCYHSPCGELLLGDCGGRLCLCDWREARHHAQVIRRVQQTLNACCTEGNSPLLERAAHALGAFFSGAGELRPLPLHPCGSAFQCRVWNALLHLPRGQTITYGELAQHLGTPTAARAVANACGANALSLFLPCHRVIGSHGAPGGYAGGAAAKRYILNLERDM